MRHKIKDYKLFLPENILNKWNPEIRSAKENADAVQIDIYDIIGVDYWTGEGISTKQVSDVLSNNKGKDVVVNINSPGGDFFEGIGIYNLLKTHDGNVTVNVVGLAASAASVIAMAGDNILIGENAFIMIHNAWTVWAGDKNEMQKAIDRLSMFDSQMADLYVQRTENDRKSIVKMMDSETWFDGKLAIEKGFADNLLAQENMKLDKNSESSYNSALKDVDNALRKQGKTRSERRAIIKSLTNTPRAVDDQDLEQDTPRAVEKQIDLTELIKALKG